MGAGTITLLTPILGVVFCIAAITHVRRSDGRRWGNDIAIIGLLLACTWLAVAMYVISNHVEVMGPI